MASSVEGWPWWARKIGYKRMDRFARWLDRRADGTQGEERCPWVTPIGSSQCTRKVSHRGVCRTETLHTVKSSGRSFTTTREWYGINYC